MDLSLASYAARAGKKPERSCTFFLQVLVAGCLATMSATGKVSPLFEFLAFGSTISNPLFSPDWTSLMVQAGTGLQPLLCDTFPRDMPHSVRRYPVDCSARHPA